MIYECEYQVFVVIWFFSDCKKAGGAVAGPMALAALAVAASLCAAAPAALPLCGGEGDANEQLR